MVVDGYLLSFRTKKTAVIFSSHVSPRWLRGVLGYRMVVNLKIENRVFWVLVFCVGIAPSMEAQKGPLHKSLDIKFQP